jgi:hypothetical protein
MKTKQTITKTWWTSLLTLFLATLLAGQAHGQIYVVNQSAGTVGKYNLDGTTVNASLITGLSYPSAIAASGGNLFVGSGGFVGVYNASTGATINASLVPWFGVPADIAVSGENLFAAEDIQSFITESNATTGAFVNGFSIGGFFKKIAVSGENLFAVHDDVIIAEFNITTGALVNLIYLGDTVGGIAVSGGNVFVEDVIQGTIAEYDATTWATINASLVSGLTIYPWWDPTSGGIAVAGGKLFVADRITGTIGEYDATTGATINASLVSGLNGLVAIAVVEPYSAQVQQPIKPDGSSVFNVNRGVVPVKFTLTSNGVATCALPLATISLTRTAGTVLGSIDESTFLLSSDSGSNFRLDGCQYGYNLSTNSLGTGTYKVNISIDGIVVGSGSFSLK